MYIIVYEYIHTLKYRKEINNEWSGHTKNSITTVRGKKPGKLAHSGRDGALIFKDPSFFADLCLLCLINESLRTWNEY